MNAIAQQPVRHISIIQGKDLLALARFHNLQERAITFYLSSAKFPDKSHRAEMIAIKQLRRSIVSSHLDRHKRHDELLSDLDAVVARAERMQETSPGFKAIFACGPQRLWREFDLPVKTDIRFLKADTRFYLAPLVRAMDLSRPYCVVLVEHGKARSFVARGVSIQEIDGALPQQGLPHHVDDSRVGWSHHIEGDQRQHVRIYVQMLSQEIQRFTVAERCSELIVECREDLWGEIGPYFLNNPLTVLHTKLPPQGFNALPKDALDTALPVIQLQRQKFHANLLAAVEENAKHGVSGASLVHEKLEQGRIETLLLGPPSDAVILECIYCGASAPEDSPACPSCSSTELKAMNAQEILVRKALLRDIEIVPLDTLEISCPGNVVALLRY